MTNRSLLFPALLAVGVITLALGITGRWDYEEARRVECAYKRPNGLAYDADRDVCTPALSAPNPTR